MLQANRLEAEHALQLSQRALVALVGPDQWGTVQSAPKPTAFRFSADVLRRALPDWEGRVKAHNPDLRAQQLAVGIARQEYFKAQAGHLPRADLVASYAKSESENINLVNQSNQTRSLGAQITVPLYAGGGTEAATQQAAFGRARAEAELDHQTEKALLELHKHYLTIGQVQGKLRALDNALVTAQALLDATQKSVEGGVRTPLDVLQAVQQLAQLRRDRLQAEYSGLISAFRLRWLAGELTPADLP